MDDNTEIQVINSPTKLSEQEQPEVEKKSLSSSHVNLPTSGHHRVHSGPHSTKIIEFLHELKDDVVNEAQPNFIAGDYVRHLPPRISPKSGLTEVYVEHNGRFTKTPKDVAKQLSNGLHYLQSTDAE